MKETYNNERKKVTDTEVRTRIKYFIQQGYLKKIASWRRILQTARNSKRRVDHSYRCYDGEVRLTNTKALGERKVRAMQKFWRENKGDDIAQYVGIAADEPTRLKRLSANAGLAADRGKGLPGILGGKGDTGRTYQEVWVCFLRERSADRHGGGIN